MGDEEELVITLRGLLQSSKGGLPLIRLKADLVQMQGPVNFQDYNCANMEDFLKKHPQEFRVQAGRVEATAHAASNHITKLVKQQHSKGQRIGGLSNVQPPRRPHKRSNIKIALHPHYDEPLGPPTSRPPWRFTPPRHLIQTLEKSSKENFTNKIDKKEENEKYKAKANVTFNQPLEPLPLMGYNLPPVQVPLMSINNPLGPVSLMNGVNNIPPNSPAVKRKSPKSSRKQGGAIFDFTDSLNNSIIPKPSLPKPAVQVKSLVDPVKSVGRNMAAARLERIREKNSADTLEKKEEPPTPPPPPPPVVEKSIDIPEKTGNWVLDLEKLCLIKTFTPPKYLTTSHTVGKKKTYNCVLTVGEKKFYSYPEECIEEVKSKEICAQYAYEFIINGGDTSISKFHRTCDLAVFVQRLFTLCTDEITMEQIPDMYLKTFSELVPQHWDTFVETNSQFVVDRKNGYRCLRRAHTDKEPSLNVPNVEKSDLPKFKKPTKLPDLVLPDDEHWYLYITFIKGNNICCRLIGDEYSGAYDNMYGDLELELMEIYETVDNFVIDEYYAVKDASKNWFRAQLKHIDKVQQKGLFHLIDSGEEEEFEFKDMTYLADKYRKLPAQAFTVALNGFEKFPEIPLVHEAIKSLTSQLIIVGKVVEVFPQGNPIANVVLIDTSTTIDVNVNLQIMDLILKSLEAPQLIKSMGYKQMKISHINLMGDVFLNSIDSSVKCMESAIDYFTNLLEKDDREKLKSTLTMTKISSRQIYLAWHPDLKRYCRGKIKAYDEGPQVLILFIDYGSDAWVSIGQLIDCWRISESLCKVPPLTAQVHLTGINEWSPSMINYVAKFRLTDQTLFVEMMRSENSVPIVDIYFSDKANNMRCLNTFLKNDLKSEEKAIIKLDVLPAPKIPEQGGLFNVHIIMAASPSNFLIQPLEGEPELNKLMEELQDQCNESSDLLCEDDIQVGGYYAVKDSSNIWYRCCMQGIVSAHSLSVYLVDFGNLIVVPLENNFQSLPSKFQSLPYQCIRANLAGLVPIDGDWTPHDCVTFQNMVAEKDFVAVVTKVSKDQDFLHVGVKLIDTSQTNDIYVHKTLIEMGIAVESV